MCGFQPAHDWLISALFLDDINNELALFKRAHNLRPVPGERGMNPMQLRFMGFTTQGVRGMWEGRPVPYPGERDLDDERAGQLWEQEVTSYVELDDPLCPFSDERNRLAFQEFLNGESRALHPIDRWVAGLETMQNMLEREIQR
jgi:hypothetical protein